MPEPYFLTTACLPRGVFCGLTSHCSPLITLLVNFLQVCIKKQDDLTPVFLFLQVSFPVLGLFFSILLLVVLPSHYGVLFFVLFMLCLLLSFHKSFLSALLSLHSAYHWQRGSKETCHLHIEFCTRKEVACGSKLLMDGSIIN